MCMCVCFSSALMVRFSLRDVLSGDYVGHPRWEGAALFLFPCLFLGAVGAGEHHLGLL